MKVFKLKNESLMQSKKIIVAILFLIGLSVMIYIVQKENLFKSELIEINNELKLDITVTKAYNDRGIYILNDIYYLPSSLSLENHAEKFVAKDDAVWRPKGNKFLPRLSNIEAPFKLIKEEHTEKIQIIKDKDTILLKLNKNLE